MRQQEWNHIWISRKNILLWTVFFNQKISYFPLVWMCHSRDNHRKINRLHKHCLCIFYSDKTSSFEAPLEKDGSVCIYNRNLQLLAAEMYNTRKGLSPSIITELFEKKKNEHLCSMRHISWFTIPAGNLVYHGTESSSFPDLKIWNILADSLRKIDVLEASKTAKKMLETWEMFVKTLHDIYSQLLVLSKKK